MTSVFLLPNICWHNDEGRLQVLAIFTIKAVMLVYGIMVISVDAHANKDWTHHLKREPVWDAIHKLVQQ